MKLSDYEQAAARTINTTLSDRDRLLDAAAGLAEEAGEVLGIVRKHVFPGHAFDREKLRAELGDALWCLTMTARTAGLSLEEIATSNIEKLAKRYPDGFSSAASKNERDAISPQPEIGQDLQDSCSRDR